MSKLEELIRQYCPDGVEYVKIGDVCKIKTPPCKIQTGAYQETGQYPIIDQGQKQIAGYTDDENATLADGEYILYGDHTCIVKYHNGRFAQGADGLKILTANGSISKYVFYAFCAYNLTTTEYKRHWTQAKVIEIPLPPLPVQEEIVRILDTFTELQAELQAELQKRKLQYNYYLDNLLNFNRGGCQAEERWMKMSEVFEMRNGYTPSKANKEFWEGGTIPWFRMEDIRQNGRILSDSILHITPKGVKGKGLFKANSFILATTATIGEHALLIADSLANQRFTNLSIRKSLENDIYIKFMFYYMFIIDEWCRNNTNVSSFASVDMAKFCNLSIPIPSLSEQKRIADILDRFDRLTNDLSSGLPAEMEKRRRQYEYYRDKLLSFKRKGA